MNSYFEERKKIIKSIVANFKEEEYNNYCFEINKCILALNNTTFKIGDIECTVVNNQLYVKLDIKSDFRDLKLSVNNVKFLAKELNDICVERRMF